MMQWYLEWYSYSLDYITTTKNRICWICACFVFKDKLKFVFYFSCKINVSIVIHMQISTQFAQQLIRMVCDVPTCQNVYKSLIRIWIVYVCICSIFWSLGYTLYTQLYLKISSNWIKMSHENNKLKKTCCFIL